MNPPFHADHVGSLLRPEALRRAFRRLNAGEIGHKEFQAVVDGAIVGAIRLQEDLGLEAVTDGEFRRASYWSHFLDGIEGLDVRQARFDFRDDAGDAMHFLAPHVVGRIRRGRPLSGREFDFLDANTTRTPKTTLPSPPTFHFWDARGSVTAAGYADLDAYFADLAQVYRDEIADLAARGARYIQLDDVALAMLCDPELRARIESDGDDPARLLDRYVDLFNACLAGRPADMTVALHVCRGNFKGHWLSQGGYDYVAERLFNDIGVDAYFLEFDTPRAGDFAPLAQVPNGKSVVLGLVSSKVPDLERSDDLKRRIEEASRFVPVERLALSPQCGFASAVSGNPVSFQDQVEKLSLVVRVAREVWG